MIELLETGFQPAQPPIVTAELVPQWLALQTRSRHERKVVRQLELKNITSYLPLYSAVHQWSDRRKKLELPLFPGYTFVRITPSPEERLAVLQTVGAVRLVGTGSEPQAIPDKDIEGIKIILESKVLIQEYPFGLKAGQRVRVRGGCLDGVEGLLVDKRGFQLVISIEAIARSLVVDLTSYTVERC